MMSNIDRRPYTYRMKILLVEDSHKLQRSLGTGLLSSGFAVDQAYDGLEASGFLASNEYDCIVLDLMIPKIDGLELLRRLRAQRNNTHVLILSAKDQVDDRIRGLDLGADDYLVKPFSFDELVSRIRAVTRRLRKDERGATTVIQIESVSIDTVAKTVMVEGEFIAVTPHEYALVELLSRRRGQVFSHDQLIDRVYKSDHDVTRNAIEAHVSSLRRKLKAAGVKELISTRRGFGYYIAV